MASEGIDVQTSLTGSDSVAEALAQPEPTQDQPRTEASVSGDIGAEPGTAEEVETEVEAQPEVEATPETKEGDETTPEGEGEEEETADDWLPDEQEKEFSLETLARYAERYGYTAEQLQGDANLQRLIKDTINGDIARRQQETQVEEIIEEPAELQVSPEEQQRRYTEQRERHQAFVGNVVGQVFDQKLVNQMELDLYRAFGVDPDKLPEDYDGSEKAQLLASAPKVGGTLARYLVDGVYTALPYLLLQPDPNTGQAPIVAMLEHLMPGISELHSRSSYQMQWHRAAREVGGDNLPAYGSPEFTETLEKAAEKIPGFNEIVYRDDKGRVLPVHEQAYRRYVILAKAIASGKKPATRPSPAKRQSGDRLAEFIKAENSRSSF